MERILVCPHCEQRTNSDYWPFCSNCRLWLLSLDELDLSPTASITVWRKEVTIGYLN